MKLYQMIRDNGGWDAFNMVIVEEYPCYTKVQACKREYEVMGEMKATMNTHLPIISQEEKKQRQKEYKRKQREKEIEYYWKMKQQRFLSKIHNK